MDSQNNVLNVKTACHNVSAKEALSVVFWDALMNIWVSIDSIWAEDTVVSFIVWGKVLEKIGKVPNMCKNQYQRMNVMNVSSRQCKCLFYKLPFWKSFLALCKANDAKANIVSVFTGAVFMNDRE